MMLKILTSKFVVDQWTPCGDAVPFIPNDWKGTVLDVLACEPPTFGNRKRYDWIIWIVLHAECYPSPQIANKILRLWACDCAERSFKWQKMSIASHHAINVSRRYAHGKCGVEELRAAHKNASYAAAYASYPGQYMGDYAKYAVQNALEAFYYFWDTPEYEHEQRWQLDQLAKIIKEEME